MHLGVLYFLTPVGYRSSGSSIRVVESAAVMSTSKPTAKRKVGDEHRQFQEKWETEYFFVEHRGMPTCLICTEKLAVQKEYNVRRHYSTKHAEEYAKYKGDEREDRVAKLKTCLLRQQDLFKKACCCPQL